jgi:hypothetical protein
MALVCSGACGADLLALDAAGELGLRRRMVLPFEPARFRAGSVTDRPGLWGPLFDQTVAQIEAAGDLVVLGHAGNLDEAYVAVNRAIFDEAARLAHTDPDGRVRAVVVWEGRSRGPGDLTDSFAREARVRGLDVVEILTHDDRPDR